MFRYLVSLFGSIAVLDKVRNSDIRDPSMNLFGVYVELRSQRRTIAVNSDVKISDS